jgi:4-hydroxy-4-methyl-2-oxoglutarate aldolase
MASRDPLDPGELTTAMIADACLRIGVPVRCAPSGIRALDPGLRTAGRALPARHYGSVDVFFEALESATGADVLVIDNGGRTDEGCIGDLVALEVEGAGVRGIALWGLHRDTADLRAIALPVFSYGTCPAGPQRLDPREPEALVEARFGPLRIVRDDAVYADDDGCVFVALSRAEEVLAAAERIRETERRQAGAARGGTRLRDQFRFPEYLEARKSRPSLTFRDHLRRIGGAIEE